MSETTKTNILWKVAQLTMSMASVRYRALLPIVAMQDQKSINNKITANHEVNLSKVDILIFVKSFSPCDLMLAQRAHSKNIPIILDLCDNIFIENYGAKKGRTKSSAKEHFISMSTLSSGIVSSTESLSAIIKNKIEFEIPIQIIPDGIETAPIRERMKKIVKLSEKDAHKSYKLIELSENIQNTCGQLKAVAKEPLSNTIPFYLEKVKFLLTNNIDQLLCKATKRAKDNITTRINITRDEEKKHDYKQILWCGNHGAAYSNFGMLDILLEKESLENIAKDIPVELIVVSNCQKKYNEHIKPLAIKSRYIEWDADEIDHHLKNADVTIIPNSLNEFSLCKSANRTLLSLSMGTPVVATSTPALLPLKECIILDDFERGLRSYLCNPSTSRQHISLAKTAIEDLYGINKIKRGWLDVIKRTEICRPEHTISTITELAIIIQLPQDIELARPLWEEAKKRGISTIILTSLSASERWPPINNLKNETETPSRILPDKIQLEDAIGILNSVKALISVTESNLGPHRFAHKLTKIANSCGVYTATMQHGFENIGLTYNDDTHNIKTINFASRRIYTWGHNETLDKNIPPKVKKKCFPVGCTKFTATRKPSSKDIIPKNRPIIGIFENLHWHRYSREYRRNFIRNLEWACQQNPNIDFLIKPHPTGAWLTKIDESEKPTIDNLIIIGQNNTSLSNRNSSSIIENLMAVITTPSTIALDACLVNKPVAIVSENLETSNYHPLSMLRNKEDWQEFIIATLDDCLLIKEQEKSTNFINRTLISGNATSRILEDIELYI